MSNHTGTLDCNDKCTFIGKPSDSEIRAFLKARRNEVIRWREKNMTSYEVAQRMSFGDSLSFLGLLGLLGCVLLFLGATVSPIVFPLIILSPLLLGIGLALSVRAENQEIEPEFIKLKGEVERLVEQLEQKSTFLNGQSGPESEIVISIAYDNCFVEGYWHSKLM